MLIILIIFSTSYSAAKLLEAPTKDTGVKMCSKEHLQIFVPVSENTQAKFPAKKGSKAITDICPSLERSCCTLNEVKGLKAQVLAFNEKFTTTFLLLQNLTAFIETNADWIKNITTMQASDEITECLQDINVEEIANKVDTFIASKFTIQQKLAQYVEDFLRLRSSIACQFCSPDLASFFGEFEGQPELIYNRENVTAIFENHYNLTQLLWFEYDIMNTAIAATCFYRNGIYSVDSSFRDDFNMINSSIESCYESSQEEGFNLMEYDDCYHIFQVVGGLQITNVTYLTEKLLSLPLEAFTQTITYTRRSHLSSSNVESNHSVESANEFKPNVEQILNRIKSKNNASFSHVSERQENSLIQSQVQDKSVNESDVSEDHENEIHYEDILEVYPNKFFKDVVMNLVIEEDNGIKLVGNEMNLNATSYALILSLYTGLMAILL